MIPDPPTDETTLRTIAGMVSVVVLISVGIVAKADTTVIVVGLSLLASLAGIEWVRS